MHLHSTRLTLTPSTQCRRMEKAAFFLQTDLLSTLICHENIAFQKRSYNPSKSWRFSVNRIFFKTLWKWSFSKTVTWQQSRDFPHRVSLKTNPKWPVFVAFSIFFWCSSKGKHLMYFLGKISASQLLWCCVIGRDLDLRFLVNQSKLSYTPIAPFSRALNQSVHEFALSFDWFTVLSLPFVIG